MKLEVGEFYLSVRGEVIYINDENINGEFKDLNFNLYFKNGKFKVGYKSNDLIAHIPKELHYALIQGVNEYHTNKYFKSMIDENFNNLSNKK